MERPSRELTLGDYLAPVIARRWLILGVVLLAAAAAYGYNERREKVFETSTKLYVAQEANPVIGAGAGFSDDRSVQNQATLLTSSDVAAVVARKIGYKGSPSALAGRVSATRSTGADFITITARGPSGKEAAAIANGFAQAFIEVRSNDRRGEINKAMQQLEQQLRGIPSTASNSQQRADISGQIRQLKVALSSSPGVATQVDPAGVPGAAISPKPKRNALFVGAITLFVCVFLAYFFERFDPRLRQVEDAAAIYRRPILASIAHDPEIDWFDHGLPAISPAAREAFRELRVKLHLEALDRPLRTILVTSASAAEGKSTVVRNLALALHEAGQRVAVVDADLRKPSLSGLLHVPEGDGLTDVLVGDKRLEDVLQHIEVESRGIEQLERMSHPESSLTGNGGARHPGPTNTITLVAAGPQPANPPAVLESAAAKTLLLDIAGRHDVVIIDTPPLLEVSDAIPLLGQADAVVLAVRAGTTQRRGAQRAMDLIGRVPHVNFVGIVANDLMGADTPAYGYGYGGEGDERTDRLSREQAAAERLEEQGAAARRPS